MVGSRSFSWTAKSTRKTVLCGIQELLGSCLPIITTFSCGKSIRNRIGSVTCAPRQLDNLQKDLEKKRKDYAFRGQFNEKPSIIPGCPGSKKTTSQRGIDDSAILQSYNCPVTIHIAVESVACDRSTVSDPQVFANESDDACRPKTSCTRVESHMQVKQMHSCGVTPPGHYCPQGRSPAGSASGLAS